MAKTCVVLVTVDGSAAAAKITNAVIKSRLAACVNEIKKVKTVAAEQNALVKNLELARAMLMDYCDSLAKTVSAVECMKGDLRKDFITQTKYIFELARTVNRSPTTPKTTELSAELRHEHSEHSSVEGSSADRRENTVHYLPKSSGLRARAG